MSGRKQNCEFRMQQKRGGSVTCQDMEAWQGLELELGLGLGLGQGMGLPRLCKNL